MLGDDGGSSGVFLQPTQPWSLSVCPPGSAISWGLRKAWLGECYVIGPSASSWTGAQLKHRLSIDSQRLAYFSLSPFPLLFFYYVVGSGLQRRMRWTLPRAWGRLFVWEMPGVYQVEEEKGTGIGRRVVLEGAQHIWRTAREGFSLEWMECGGG